MADRLTQTQDNLGEFVVQMFAGLNYVRHHHYYADIPNQPNQAPLTVSFSDPDPAADTAGSHLDKDKEKEKVTNGEATSQSQSQSQKKDQKKKDESKDEKKDGEPPKEDEPHDKPHSHEEHTANLRELAQGLVLKEQQIEYLIQSLPGIGSSERDQERRIRELQEELRVVEAERKEKEVLRERMVEELGRWLVGGRRVP